MREKCMAAKDTTLPVPHKYAEEQLLVVTSAGLFLTAGTPGSIDP